VLTIVGDVALQEGSHTSARRTQAARWKVPTSQSKRTVSRSTSDEPRRPTTDDNHKKNDKRSLKNEKQSLTANSMDNSNEFYSENLL
jgi:hypothetical protein